MTALTYPVISRQINILTQSGSDDLRCLVW